MPRLTEQQVQRYRREGFLAPLRALSDDRAAELLAELVGLERAGSGRLSPFLNAKPHLLLPWLWSVVHEPSVVDAVASLLGPDLVCFGSSLIAKWPGSPGHVAWHQDATYWGLSEPEAVTAWIALTPSDAANGCVRVLPATHHRALPHGDSGDCTNMLGRREKLLLDLDTSEAINLCLRPGEMSLHHVLTLHGSKPNHSQLRRVGFSVRYIPGHVYQRTRSRTSATLVRGRDHGHFEPEQAPEGCLDPAALARHRRLFRASMEAIFDGKLKQRQGIR